MRSDSHTGGNIEPWMAAWQPGWRSARGCRQASDHHSSALVLVGYSYQLESSLASASAQRSGTATADDFMCNLPSQWLNQLSPLTTGRGRVVNWARQFDSLTLAGEENQVAASLSPIWAASTGDSCREHRPRAHLCSCTTSSRGSGSKYGRPIKWHRLLPKDSAHPPENPWRNIPTRQR